MRSASMASFTLILSFLLVLTLCTTVTARSHPHHATPPTRSQQHHQSPGGLLAPSLLCKGPFGLTNATLINLSKYSQVIEFIIELDTTSTFTNDDEAYDIMFDFTGITLGDIAISSNITMEMTLVTLETNLYTNLYTNQHPTHQFSNTISTTTTITRELDLLAKQPTVRSIAFPPRRNGKDYPVLLRRLHGRVQGHVIHTNSPSLFSLRDGLKKNENGKMDQFSQQKRITDKTNTDENSATNIAFSTTIRGLTSGTEYTTPSSTTTPSRQYSAENFVPQLGKIQTDSRDRNFVSFSFSFTNINDEFGYMAEKIEYLLLEDVNNMDRQGEFLYIEPEKGADCYLNDESVKVSLLPSSPLPSSSPLLFNNNQYLPRQTALILDKRVIGTTFYDSWTFECRNIGYYFHGSPTNLFLNFRVVARDAEGTSLVYYNSPVYIH